MKKNVIRTPNTMADKKAKKKDKVVIEEEPSIVHGVYVFPNGDRYEGEYMHTADGAVVRSGFGKHISSQGLVYEGNWTENKMNGTGCVRFPSGASYEGDIVDNKMHGNGRYKFPDEAVYEGGFLDNRLEGNGTLIDPSGQSWCGTFNNRSANALRFKLKM